MTTEPNEKSAGQLMYEDARDVAGGIAPWDKLDEAAHAIFEEEARDTRPGADVTDGATGKPYSQAGEKSAGQQLYEKSPGATLLSWEQLSAVARAKYEFNATVTPKAQTIKAP